MKRGRLVIASNRLPFALRRRADGWQLQESTGGLVAALGPILRERGGVWIGWPGSAGSSHVKLALTRQARSFGYAMRPVMLTADERDKFYQGFSNEVIWPLFHDLQTFCNFRPEYWDAYLSVNRKFARAIKGTYRPGDFVWVHDYHLMDVAQELRRIGANVRPGFFLHIPFPPPDLFLKLPWRDQVLDALFEYDLIGFQTPWDQRNFVYCVQVLRRDVAVERGADVWRLHLGGRTIRIGSFPISIDAEALEARARSAEVTQKAERLLANRGDVKILVGVDRLDYTKGIPNKLSGFRRALQRYPDLRGRATLVQIVSPSREKIPRYNELKAEIEGLIGRINGEFSESGWVPIHYVYRNVESTEILAWFRDADAALVTPLKDGMNLVAKEFCIANLRGRGVLILSEFAGAARQMGQDALLVNPYDIDGVADAIHRALTMPVAEREARLEGLRRLVQDRDIFWWVESYLKEAQTEPKPAALEAAAARPAAPSNGLLTSRAGRT